MSLRLPFTLFFACLVCSSGVLMAQNDPTQVAEEVVEVEAQLITASGLANQGDKEGALKIYEELLKADPSLSAAAYAASRLYASTNEEEALKLMQQAHRHDADNDYIAQALAEMLGEADRHLQAAGLYKSLFEKYPSREDFLLEQTRSLAQGGKPREGLRAIELHVSKTGRLTPYLGQQRFTLAVSMNDPKVAIRALEELMAAFPDNPEYYQELAQFYRRTGDEGSAKAIWTQMAERFPDDSRAQLGLAGQSKLTGEEEDFIRRLEPIFADEQLDIDSKIMQLMPIVQEVANRGDTVLANRVLPLAEKLTVVHPEDPKSFAIYADLLLQSKRQERAVDAYRKTLALDPSVYLVWDQLLLSLAELGNYDELLKSSDEALMLFPNQARLYYYNGRALARTGDVQGAENTLMQGTVLALDDQVLLFDIHEALGRVQLRDGRFEDALKNIDRAISIRPKNAGTLALKAEVFLRSDRRPQAEEVLAQAVKENPQHPYVLTIEALDQVLRAEVQLAEGTIRSAMSYGGTTWAITQEVAGDVKFLKGETQEAKVLWQKAADMGGGSYKLADKLKQGIYVK